MFLVLSASALLASNSPLSIAASAETEKQAILTLIARMEAAWNRGDFHGYMDRFANPDVVFMSRGEFQKDWQGTREVAAEQAAKAARLRSKKFYILRGSRNSRRARRDWFARGTGYRF